MKHFVWVLSAAMLVAGSALADTTAGEKKSKTCGDCHGKSPEFPKLEGQHYDYLVKALNDYKSGARKDPIMGPQAQKLSKRDISDLAAYYSRQRGLQIKY